MCLPFIRRLRLLIPIATATMVILTAMSKATVIQPEAIPTTFITGKKKKRADQTFH